MVPEMLLENVMPSCSSFIWHSRKHVARRYAIVDALWPNCSYESGMEKSTKQLGLLEKNGASGDKTLDPIISIPWRRPSHSTMIFFR